MSLYDLNITADIDRAIQEGREHFGRLALAKKNLAALSPTSRQRPAAQEVVDTEEAELDRIAGRIHVSTGTLCEMIAERVVRAPWDKRRRPGDDVEDSASLLAAVDATKARVTTAANVVTLAQRELIDARIAASNAFETYRAHCAKPLVRA